MKNYKKVKKILYTVIAFSVISIAFSIYMIFKQQSEAEKEILSDYNYDVLQDLVITETEETGFPKYNTEEMLGINPDFKGWLYIPDSLISYPVVQGDDNEYYLKHSLEKEYSKFGTIFMMTGVEYGCDNLVLHGHNMGRNREEMFSTLLKYQNQEYADRHKTIYFSHIEEGKEVKYQLFAVVVFDLSNPDNVNYLAPTFETEDEYKEFVNYLISKSVYKTDFVPTENMLMLSTCYNIYGENRLLVCASPVK